VTKRPDDEPELDDGLTTSERRRRRKRTGIRIPSDNVPRRTGSQPVVAPVPEDPSLAVSIAYAFSDGTSAPVRAMPTGPMPEGLDELDDQTSIANLGPVADEPSVPQLIDDVVPDGRTRQMAAISLEALGLSAFDPDGEPDGFSLTQPLEIVDVIPSTTGPMAAMRDASSRITGEVDAVDIMVDDLSPEPSEPEPPVGDGVPRRPMGRAATVALSEDDLEELMESTLHGGVPSAPPPRARSGTSPPMPPVAAQASTDRLVERLERVRPPTMPSMPIVGGPAGVPLPAGSSSTSGSSAPGPGAPPPSPNGSAGPLGNGAAAVALPSIAAVGSPPAIPLAGIGAGALVTPATAVSGSISTSPPSTVAVAVEASVQLNDGADSGIVDAGDSGEILAEEILEVEEQSRAAPVDAFASVATTPGASPAAGATPAVTARTSSPALSQAERSPTYPSLPIMPPPTPSAAPPPAPPAAPKPPPPAPAKKPAAVATPPSAVPGGDEKRKRRGKPWFEELFDEDYLRTLPYLTPQATQAEAAMVIESLGLQPGSSVLDLGCGYGRHAMELAARGLHVVGVDLSLPMLLRGADEAQRRGLDINFMHADMREIDFDAQFDGAYCLFSTFGFFDDETNKKTASLVAKGLKPGAKFMLEVLNRDYVIGDLPNRVWWEGDGCVVLEEVEFNYFSSRVQSKRSVVFDDGRQVEQEISVRVYSLHEIGKLLHAAGLRVVEVSGSMQTKGRFLGNRSREIIVIAERKADNSKS